MRGGLHRIWSLNFVNGLFPLATAAMYRFIASTARQQSFWPCGISVKLAIEGKSAFKWIEPFYLRAGRELVKLI